MEKESIFYYKNVNAIKKLEDNTALWYTIISSNIAKEKILYIQFLFG